MARRMLFGLGTCISTLALVLALRQVQLVGETGALYGGRLPAGVYSCRGLG